MKKKHQFLPINYLLIFIFYFFVELFLFVFLTNYYFLLFLNWQDFQAKEWK